VYILDHMIDQGLKEGEEWTSDLHRQVAAKVLLCNPAVFDMGVLREGCKIINSIPKEEIEKVTAHQLRHHYHVNF